MGDDTAEIHGQLVREWREFAEALQHRRDQAEVARAEVARHRAIMDVPRPEGAAGEPGYIAVEINGEARPIAWASARADEILEGRLAGSPLVAIIPEGQDRRDHLRAIDSGKTKDPYLGTVRRRSAVTLGGNSKDVYLVVQGDRDADGRRRFLAKIWEVRR